MFELHELPAGPGRFVLAVRGEADLVAAPALRERLLNADSEGYDAIAVDLTEATFIDSSGMHAIFDLYRRTQQRGADLAIIAGDGAVLQALRLTGLDRLVQLA